MKKIILSISFFMMTVISFVFASVDRVSYQRFSLINEGGHSVLRLVYSYNPALVDAEFTESVFPYWFGQQLLIQKVVCSDLEKGFYNLAFQDGCFIVLNDGSFVGVSQQDLERKARTGFGKVIFRDGILLNFEGIEDAVSNPANKIIKIDMATKIDPRQVKALVMIYGANEGGMQLLDLNAISRRSNNEDEQNVVKEAACKVAYIPIQKIMVKNNEVLLIPDKAKTKVEYLGDGVVIAPIIPLANFNSFKTKQMLVDRLK